MIREKRSPDPGETATAVRAPVGAVEESYRRLAAGRALVLTPGTLEVRMANPFSTVETPFRVTTPKGWWFGNCGWDALGIPATLATDGTVETTCPDCDTPLAVRVEGGAARDADAVLHLLLPAREWWKDIIFT